MVHCSVTTDSESRIGSTCDDFVGPSLNQNCVAISMAKQFKEEGNSCYRKGNYNSAIDCYEKALDSLCSGIPTNDDEASLMNDLGLAINSNMAVCWLKLQNFEEAIDFCDMALKFDFYNVKARYRRACSLLGLGKIEEARYDLQTVLWFEPDNMEVQKEFEKIRSKDLIEEQLNNDRSSKPKGKEKINPLDLKTQPSTSCSTSKATYQKKRTERMVRQHINKDSGVSILPGSFSELMYGDKGAMDHRVARPTVADQTGSSNCKFKVPTCKRWGGHNSNHWKKEKKKEKKEQKDMKMDDAYYSDVKQFLAGLFGKATNASTLTNGSLRATNEVKDGKVPKPSTFLEDFNSNNYHSKKEKRSLSAVKPMDSWEDNIVPQKVSFPDEPMTYAEGRIDSNSPQSPVSQSSSSCKNTEVRPKFRFSLLGRPECSLGLSASTYDRISKGEVCEFYDKKSMRHMVVRVHRPDQPKVEMVSPTTSVDNVFEVEDQNPIAMDLDKSENIHTSFEDSTSLNVKCQSQAMFLGPLHLGTTLETSASIATSSPSVEMMESSMEASPIFYFQASKSCESNAFTPKFNKLYNSMRKSGHNSKRVLSNPGVTHGMFKLRVSGDVFVKGHQLSARSLNRSDYERSFSRKSKRTMFDPGDLERRFKIRVLSATVVDSCIQPGFSTIGKGKIKRYHRCSVSRASQVNYPFLRL